MSASRVFSRSKQKDTGANNPTSGLPGFDSTTSSPSSSVLNVTHAQKPKRGLSSSLRDLLGSRKHSAKKEPTAIPTKTNDTSENAAPADKSENAAQYDSLQSKRADIDLSDDPNYQPKLDAINYSLEIIELFENLSDVIALAVPDVLGQAVKYITKILEKLKKMVENKREWNELLVSIDQRQRGFNEQVEGVEAHELTPKLEAAMKQYARALEKLSARIMKEAGVVPKESVKEGRLKTIREFADRFLNAESAADDIAAYKRKLDEIINDVRTELTVNIAITVNRVDRKVDNLDRNVDNLGKKADNLGKKADNIKALIFLEGSSGGTEQSEINHKRCLKDTRVDVLKDIRRWHRAENDSEKPVYCIGDVAGTGKSTIAVTMAEEWSKEQCFSFFFSTDSAHKARTLCISLAKQVIASCYGQNWDEYWAKLPSDLSSPISQNVENLWEKLVAQPFGICGVHKRHVLVVDALDECEKGTRVQLLKCLLGACTSKSQPEIRLLLTTRKEEDIIREMAAFHDAIVLRSLRDSEASRADITRYVNYRLGVGEVIELGTEQRKQLIDRCNGLFMFASLACDLLKKACADDLPRLLQDILDKFTSLDTLYLQTLSQVGNSLDYTRARLMDILRVILVARESFSITDIAALLSMKVNSVEKIVKQLGSILSSGAIDQPVYILHATLKEFLLRERLKIEEKMELKTGGKEIENEYYISQAEAERAVLKGCLSNVMAHGLIFNICSLETSFLTNEEVIDMDNRINRCITSALHYSCLNWTSHLAAVGYDDEILRWLEEFMNNRFLSWLEVLSVTERVRFAPGMLTVLIEWMRTNNQDETMAREMYRFVSTFESVIAQSAPHIYLSALTFTPGNSPLSEHYRKLYPRTLRIQSGGYSRWPPVQNVSFGHTGWVRSVAFSHDSKRLASGSSERTVRVWDAETGEAVGAPFRGHDGSVTSVAFSHDSKWLVSGSEDKTVRVWDAETGEAIGAPLRGHDDWVTSVAFSHNSKRLVSGSNDSTVRVWDAETREAISAPFRGHDSPVTSVAFSHDSKWLVSGSEDRTVRVWDAETGEVVGAPFRGYDLLVRSVAFSHDSKRLLSGSSDGTVRVWDAETGELVGVPFGGYGSWAMSFALSHDSKRLVSGSSDWRVRIWDVETGKAIGVPFSGHNGWVTSVAFSHDSKRLVSGSEDRTVRVWDITASGPNSLISSSEVINGWLVGSNSKRLFWVPPELRTGLFGGGLLLIIGSQLKTKLNLSSFVYGESWSQCKLEEGEPVIQG